MAEKIPLADVLGSIAEELLKAQAEAVQRGAKVMQFAECEVEFSVKAETEGGGGLKIWVLNLSGKAKKTEANKIRIKFTAIPGTAITAPAMDAAPAAKPVRQPQQKA